MLWSKMGCTLIGGRSYFIEIQIYYMCIYDLVKTYHILKALEEAYIIPELRIANCHSGSGKRAGPL